MATDQMWCDTTEREQRVNCTTEQLIPESLPTKPKISEHIDYYRIVAIHKGEKKGRVKNTDFPDFL